ncbi:NDP-sugar synthase [Candidatus Peregrinibacteria bacterium]|nr:NDP-sugar synthase [Candidatus Peregrinibacteria bacterium]MBI3816066.1 NDP-sugar synthase [Candidatus Peregrinibacteria bacterium]
MQAFILAGGFATRLWPLTEKRAKPLLPLAGKPIITHLLEKIPREIPVTVSTNAAFAEGFERWKQTIDRPVELIIEQTRKDEHKLGALGAVAAWISARRIDDDLLLLTGDNYLGFSLAEFLRAFHPPHALLAAHDIENLAHASSFGTVLTDPNDPKRVIGFEEKPKESKTTLVSTGCSILPRATLPIVLEFAEREPENVGGIFEEFLRRKIAIDCFTFREPWLDVGSFASYLEAHRLLLGEKVLIDTDSTLETTTCTGSVSVAAGSRVIGSELCDTLVFERCTITDCTLRDCVIDEGCTLEGVDLRGKMIRAGTVLRLG